MASRAVARETSVLAPLLRCISVVLLAWYRNKETPEARCRSINHPLSSMLPGQKISAPDAALPWGTRLALGPLLGLPGFMLLRGSVGFDGSEHGVELGLERGQVRLEHGGGLFTPGERSARVS